MSNIRILVSAVGGDIGSSVIKSLEGEGRTLFGCDMIPSSCHSLLPSNLYQVPPASDTNAYLKAIFEIASRLQIDFFVPVSEAEITIVDKYRSVFQDQHIGIMLNNPLIVGTFCDKYKTARFLHSLGIHVPKTYLLKGYTDGLAFPMICKRRCGCGGKGIWRVENRIDLEYLRTKDSGELILQELVGVPEQEYTTGVFSDGHTISSISFRRRLGFGGLTVDALLVQEPILEQLSEIVAQATNLIGSINIQCRKVGDTFFPFEINPRMSSTLRFRKVFGFDDAVWWIDALEGKGYSYQPKYKSGRAIRSLCETYSDLASA